MAFSTGSIPSLRGKHSSFLDGKHPGFPPNMQQNWESEQGVPAAAAHWYLKYTMSAKSCLLNSLGPRLIIQRTKSFFFSPLFTLRQIKVVPFAWGLCWEKSCALQSEQAALRLTDAGNKSAQGFPKGAGGLGTLVREQPHLRGSTLNPAAFTSKCGTSQGQTQSVWGSSSVALGFVCFEEARRSPSSVGNLLSGWRWHLCKAGTRVQLQSQES